MKINTISTKILLWLTPFFISILLITTYLIDSKMNEQIVQDLKKQANIDANKLSKLIEEYQSKALETSLFFANNAEVISAYELPDELAVDALEKTVAPLRESITEENGNSDFKVHFHRPPAKSLYRNWTNKRFDDLSGFRNTILHVYQTKKPLKAIELGKGGFAIRGIAPILKNEDYKGSVEMFYNPMDIIKILTGNDSSYFAFYAVNKTIASSLFLPEQLKENYSDEIGDYLISKVSIETIKPKEIIKEAYLKQTVSSSEITTDISDNTATSYIPLKDFSGKTIGIMLFSQDISKKMAAVSDFVFVINIVIGGLFLLLYIALILVVKYIVSNKLSIILSANQALESGNISYFDNDEQYKILAQQKSSDEIGLLVASYQSMVKVQTTLLNQIDIFTSEIDNGNLSYRNNNDLKGVYSEILNKINGCIEVMVHPIDKTINYLEQISNGVLPDTINENYKGDFDRIKSALNLLIKSISSLNNELDLVYQNQTDGNISYQAPSKKYEGFYKELLQKINMAFGKLDNYLSDTIQIAVKYSNGDLSERMKDLPGELSKFSNSINQIGNSVEMLSVELNSLSNSISNGLLDVRADERKAKGQFQVILLGLNKTLDAVIHPLNVTAEYVDRISKGDIPAKITEDYKGDFNEIKNNLNLCIDSLNTMISGANRFVSNISNGKLRYRIDANQLSGEYKNIMQGLNSSMDAVVSLLDSINAPLMSIDKDFNILFLNETGASLDNKQGYELEGTKCFNHFKTQDCNTENCACLKTMNSNRPQSSETIASPGKHKLEVLYSGVPIRDKNNNTIGAFEIVFDQTAVKNQMKVAQNISQYQTEKTEELILSLESLSKGCLDCKFELETPQDEHLEVAYSNFRKISNALLSSFQSINSVLNSVNMFVAQAEKGNLKYRIDSKTFNGDYRNLVEGVNNILENVLAPINESLAVIETMESGNLSIFMTGEYEGDYQKLKEKQNSLLISLNDVLSNVKNMVVKVDDSTNTISNNTDALAAATLEQSSQAEEVASAVEELSATITQNAISSQKTSDLATENGKLAENGGNIVQETISKMKDIASVVSDSADQIEELGRASSKIGEIISVIDEIADQTNLLALNAAIEAARAGEQGRGFAVVADEVRKLAERTSDATKQISTMIIDVQKETQKAVDAMHKGKIEVDNGISFADNAGEALKKIVNSSKSLKDMVNQMASANEEQSATSEEISKNISSISQVTSESAKRIEGVSNLSDQLKNMTKELAAEISKFRLADRHHSSNNSEDRLFLQGTKNKLLR